MNDYLLTNEERIAVEVSLPFDATQGDYIEALHVAQCRKLAQWLFNLGLLDASHGYNHHPEVWAQFRDDCLMPL